MSPEPLKTPGSRHRQTFFWIPSACKYSWTFRSKRVLWTPKWSPYWRDPGNKALKMPESEGFWIAGNSDFSIGKWPEWARITVCGDEWEISVIAGNFPIFLKFLTEKNILRIFFNFCHQIFGLNFFCMPVFCEKVWLGIPVHRGVPVRFGFTIHSTDRLPIPRLPGAAVYPCLLNGTVWMSGPARSLRHPTPPLLIPLVFLLVAGPVPGRGCDRVFLFE